VITEHGRLSKAEYLLDPPPSVWEDLLLLDHAAWLEINAMDILQKTESQCAQHGRSLPREAWLGLYSAASPLCEKPPDGTEVAHSLFRRAERMAEWASLRRTADGDAIAATFATGHFVTELIDRLPEEVKQEMEAAESAAAEGDSARAEREMLEAMLEGEAVGHSDERSGNSPSDLGDSGKGKRSLEQIRQRLEGAKCQEREAQHRQQEAAGRAAQAIEAATARVDRALSEGLAGAAESLRELEQAANAFGIGWGLRRGAPPTREQIEGLERVAGVLRKSDQVRKILEMLGWAERAVASERRKSRHGRESFTHYRSQALDLEDLAPEELIGLLDPDSESVGYLDFLRRALDGELLHREYEGPNEVGRGPFVCLLDKSASMQGLPNATASALELALLQLAVRESRRFVSISFSGPGNYEVYDPGPRPDPAELIEHIDRSCAGGTEPYGPLREALDLIREDPSLKEGDVLILTDGQFARPPDEFLELLEQVREDPGVKVVAAVVGEAAGEAGFADRVLLLQDLFRDRDRLARALEGLL
jgi:uncharacterized protein with von Willebrand factor type A (vWA) domain